MSQRLKTETLACSWDSKNHTLREKGEEKKSKQTRKGNICLLSTLVQEKKSFMRIFTPSPSPGNSKPKNELGKGSSQVLARRPTI